MSAAADQPAHQAAAVAAAVPARVKQKVRKSQERRSVKAPAAPVQVRLHAVVIAVVAGEPLVCVETDERTGIDRLPSVDFIGGRHRSLGQPLEERLRRIVPSDGADFQLLDCILTDARASQGAVVIEITYMGLVEPSAVEDQPVRPGRTPHAASPMKWQSIYMKLPWEDWRHGRPSLLDGVVMPQLFSWSRAGDGEKRASRRRSLANARRRRVEDFFPSNEAAWDVGPVVERFNLLSESGLLPDAPTAGSEIGQSNDDPRLGKVMPPGDRKRLALALGSLRSAIRERPNVRPLLPKEFTLFEIQRCVEGVLGPALHKQNFRRQLETQGLLEPLGRYRSKTGGRPAQLYRFARA